MITKQQLEMWSKTEGPMLACTQVVRSLLCAEPNGLEGEYTLEQWESAFLNMSRAMPFVGLAYIFYEARLSRSDLAIWSR